MLVCPNCGSNILYGVGLVKGLPIQVGCEWCGNLWTDKRVLKQTIIKLMIMGFIANVARVFNEIDGDGEG